MEFRDKIILINLVVVALYFADRVLKYVFSTNGGEYFLLGEWLKLKLAYNTGIAFGLPFNYYLILFLYFFIFIFLVAYLILSYKDKKTINILSLSLIIAGAFSNLLDRLYVGQVIDYLDVKYYSILNLADVMIVIGVIFLIFQVCKENKKTTLTY